MKYDPTQHSGAVARLTIAAVYPETFLADGGEKRRLIMVFVESKTKFVLNPINWERLASDFDDWDADHWIGQKVTIFPGRRPIKNKQTSEIEDVFILLASGGWAGE
jgi:hypothetical protein